MRKQAVFVFLASGVLFLSAFASGQSCPESQSCSTSGAVVYAENLGSGHGVEGVATGGYGVYGFNYYGHGVHGFSYRSYAVYAEGDFASTGYKSFIEPHPDDPAKVIRYVSLEGREPGTYFRGTARTRKGRCVIRVPADFRIVTDSADLTVQLTPVGQLATMAVVSEGLDQIVVRSSKDVRFHYQVNGIRKAFKGMKPLIAGSEFVPQGADARLPDSLPSEIKQRLIHNGTYLADGSVNLHTAERLGWMAAWEKGKLRLALAVPENALDRGSPGRQAETAIRLPNR